jgi:hypothetical protein
MSESASLFSLELLLLLDDHVVDRVEEVHDSDLVSTDEVEGLQIFLHLQRLLILSSP